MTAIGIDVASEVTGGTAYSGQGPGAASGERTINNSPFFHVAPRFGEGGPPLNTGQEWLAMNGPLENGGRTEAMPSRLIQFLHGPPVGGGGSAGFDVQLGRVSGSLGGGTLALLGVGLAVVVGVILTRRR